MDSTSHLGSPQEPARADLRAAWVALPQPGAEAEAEDAGCTGADVLAALAAVVGTLRSVHEAAASASDAELSELLTCLGECCLLADAAELAVVAEVGARGLHTSGQWPLPLAGWVAAHSRRYAAGSGAGRLARLAAAVTPATTTRKAGPLAMGQDGAVLGAAALAGEVPVACADAAMSEMHRLQPHLQPETHAQVWAGYAEIAAGGDLRQVRRLRPAMYARFGRPEELTKDEEQARAHESLSNGRPDPDGMTEYRLILGPEAAATLEAALDPLCAPRRGPDGEADPRSPATRRAHALMELVTQAIRSGQGVPVRAATQLMLTLPADALTDETGCARVLGGLDAGRFLAITTARRLACNTEVTPVLLDPAGNPRVIGHRKRLFTRQQVAALHLRDEHCTFPGCTRPAGWTDAHHLIHWADGGPTELDNAALLCSFHHHVVHSRRLAGQIHIDPPELVTTTTCAGSSRPPEPVGPLAGAGEGCPPDEAACPPGAGGPAGEGRQPGEACPPGAGDSPTGTPLGRRGAPSSPAEGSTPTNLSFLPATPVPTAPAPAEPVRSARAAEQVGRARVHWDTRPGSYDRLLAARATARAS